MNKTFIQVLLIGFCSIILGGCFTTKGNEGDMNKFSTPKIEADWILNGEPIEFEGESWYPQDGFDILLATEVYRIGEYKGVEFFVDRTDVRPYNRLYTKFGQNKFRYFEKALAHD